jgi:uncharacterized protein
MTDSFIERYDNTGQARLKLPEPIPCFRCGECCRRYQVLLEQNEAERLAEFLGLDLAGLKTQYTDPRWPGLNNYLLRQEKTGCPFLRQNDREFLCSIHNIKPRACREWTGGLDRRECREGLAECWQLAVSAAGEVEGARDLVKSFEDYLRGLDA